MISNAQFGVVDIKFVTIYKKSVLGGKKGNQQLQVISNFVSLTAFGDNYLILLPSLYKAEYYIKNCFSSENYISDLVESKFFLLVWE